MHKFAISLILCALSAIGQAAAYDVPDPDLAELTQPMAAGAISPFHRFDELNSRIRDGKIARSQAEPALARLLDEIRQEYYRRGGRDYMAAEWVFPLEGYDVRSISKGRGHGYVSRGYDYFRGNRHGGHPSYDIFIKDRDQDGRDDSTGKPVRVLSMTGGVVVALESQWEQGSALRGGRYLWIYDPANEQLVYYAHNEELLVAVGDLVKPGDVVALVGRSGYNAAKRRSPTHLHLTVLDVHGGKPVPRSVYDELAHARTIKRE